MGPPLRRLLLAKQYAAFLNCASLLNDCEPLLFRIEDIG